MPSSSFQHPQSAQSQLSTAWLLSQSSERNRSMTVNSLFVAAMDGLGQRLSVLHSPLIRFLRPLLAQPGHSQWFPVDSRKAAECSAPTSMKGVMESTALARPTPKARFRQKPPPAPPRPARRASTLPLHDGFNLTAPNKPNFKKRPLESLRKLINALMKSMTALFA